jgi:hypothetical protein
VREPRRLRSGPLDIPWDHHVDVKRRSDTSISLESATTWANVDGFANISIEHKIEETIPMYMTQDKHLTELAREVIGECEGNPWDCLEKVFWSKKEIEHKRGLPPGKKEWRPDAEPHRSIWAKGEWGSDHSSSADFNVDKSFEYLHFYEENEGYEGLVITWVRGDITEVWVGGVGEFLDELRTPRDDDELPGFNSYFDNGLLWALDIFGFLEDPEFYDESESRWVVNAAREDPLVLWPDLIDRLRPKMGLMPVEIRRAAAHVDRMRRLEEEQATGQGYFWPRIYPGERE